MTSKKRRKPIPILCDFGKQKPLQHELSFGFSNLCPECKSRLSSGRISEGK